MSGAPGSGARPADLPADLPAGLPAAGITVPYRIRFDECGPDGLVRTAPLQRIAQDLAWIHSEALGYTREWYAARGLAWVVRAAELAVLAPIRPGQVLQASTAVVGFRRVWSRRRTEARFEDGSPAFWSHADYVMLDTGRGMPGRIPDELPGAFAVPPGSFEPGRVALPDQPAAATTVRTAVQPRDIDPMGHVNNSVYLDYLEEAVRAAGEAGSAAVGRVPRRVRLEYVVAAEPALDLVSSAWPLPVDREGAGTAGGWAWRLADADGRELARGQVLDGAASTVPA